MNIDMHHIANVYRTYDAAVTMCLCNIPDQHSDLPVPGPKTKPQSGNSSLYFFLFNPLCTGNPKKGTLANTEDPDEMQHNAAFHQGLHGLQRLK